MLSTTEEAGDAVVELLAQKCDATEKRSVDEVGHAGTAGRSVEGLRFPKPRKIGCL